jgi:hypothetical protein
MSDNPAGQGCYWATFERRGNDLFRFDTRIYGAPIDRPRRGDRPLGCVIGKNPGSALPRHWQDDALLPIALANDRFLPTVRAVVSRAHAAAGLTWPPGSYVQVLNLFYLCNRDLRQARERLSLLREAPRCPAERRRMAWAWFVWGGTDPLLDLLKARFRRRSRRAPFFVGSDCASVVCRAPRTREHARHTQGMRLDAPVAHLATLLAAQASGAGRTPKGPN